MSMVLRTSAIVMAALLLQAGAAFAQATPAQPPAKTPAPAPAAKPPAPGAPAPAAQPPATTQPPAAPGATPPGQTAPPVISTTTAAPQPPPTPPANYEYRVDARRDPFVSLLNRGTDAQTRSGNKPRVIRAADGAAGLMTDEVAVRGILLNKGTWLAMITGPGNKMFTVKAGDRLADGTIRAVTPQALVILQEVNDPLSLEKQREVRKPLRGGEVK